MGSGSVGPTIISASTSVSPPEASTPAPPPPAVAAAAVVVAVAVVAVPWFCRFAPAEVELEVEEEEDGIATRASCPDEDVPLPLAPELEVEAVEDAAALPLCCRFFPLDESRPRPTARAAAATDVAGVEPVTFALARLLRPPGPVAPTPPIFRRSPPAPKRIRPTPLGLEGRAGTKLN